jgi:hypothetical protein
MKMKNKDYRQELLASIAEAKGYYYDNGLVEKSTDTVVAVTEHEIAKVLLGQMSTEKDVATVESILSVVSKLPNYDKLIESVKSELSAAGFAVPETEQIESHQTGTPGWFRRMMNSIL